MPTDLPPILILMPDQFRADCLGCAEHPVIRTPNLDRLASEGTRFSHACTNSPLCMPARASFVSGTYVHNHGMWHNAGELPANDETFFHHLQAAGYHTAYVGKSHFYEHGGLHMREREPYMHARGLDDVHETTGPWATVNTDSYMTDDWATKGLLKAFRDDYQKRRETGPCAVWPSPLPTEDFMDSYIGRAGVEWIDAYVGDKPPCLFVGFGGPHEPWDAPGEYAEMYGPADTPPPIPLADPGEWVPEKARERMLNRRIAGMTEENIRGIRANYYGKITLIDHWIGQLIEAFERKGWWDDAIVVFWSDHGEMAGDFGWLHKSNFHESALRIPLIVRWPGVASAGAVSEALVETIDVFPTLLEAAGRDPSKRAFGRSLTPLLTGETTQLHDAVFSEVNQITMLRTETHKYALDSEGDGFMLYDLVQDPDERANLIGHPDHADLEAELRERVLQWLMRAQCRQRWQTSESILGPPP
jgi:choline-sulfatase